jgi:hypothetical protein
MGAPEIQRSYSRTDEARISADTCGEFCMALPQMNSALKASRK